MSYEEVAAGGYILLDGARKPYRSATPGRRAQGQQDLGRLDCLAALRAISCGGYRDGRMSFLDETTGIAARYRPCAVCLPIKYREGKAQRDRCTT
jgi:hypothetical protein